MANEPTREQVLEGALRTLTRRYVALLENGRSRILDLGGQCDPVDKMEASDPWLREARNALAYGVTDTPRPEPVAWRWTEDGKHWFGWTTNWDHYERAKKLGYRVEHAYPAGVSVSNGQTFNRNPLSSEGDSMHNLKGKES